MQITLQIGDTVKPTEETINAIPTLRAIVKRSGATGEVVDIIEDGDVCPVHVRFGHEWFFFEADELEQIK